ncbi:MAG: SIR2 family protein [Methanosarcinaceae archaeon]|nr:SIR2 family protein [Methanosarcinaceae archaeon]
MASVNFGMILKMSQTLKEIIAGFRTIPILFAGSGITRRYYNLPDWESLLKEFAMRIKNDPFSYRSYLISVKTDQTSETVFPKVASLMQTDFDRLWFQNSDFRRLKTDDFRFIESGTSPFKAEISAFLKEKSIIQSQYSEEISKLKNISVKNISAVITTNYDLFFESLFDGYKTYVGQEDLFFSAVQGIAEIYKIHGSVSDPGSLVLTEEDYSDFYDKSRYLASKLMTLFVEYPVIFIGYSLKDENIRRILSDIAYCLPDDKLKQLEKSLVFIEYQKDAAGAQVSSHSVFLGSKVISMTKITMSDFGLLYDELANKVSARRRQYLRQCLA